MRLGNMYGPDATFAGVPAADLDDPDSFSAAGAVILGAPFDGGTSHRPGARFGPQAIRFTDYLAHDGMRPHLALGVDPLTALRVVDVGDVQMLPGEIDKSLGRLEQAVTAVARAGCIPVVLGGDHSVTFPDATGVAHQVGWGRLALVHFDAHADTANTQFGSLYGHGTPMRRLIESGAVRGERFFQIGLRGYWPDPDVLDWMATQGMRSYEMTEVCDRGLGACLEEVFEMAMDGCEGVFLSVDIDVVDPGMAPGTGTPEPGGLTARQLLDAVRRCAMELPLAGIDVVEVSPPYDHAEVTAYLANRVVLEALSGMAWRRIEAGQQKAGPQGGEATGATAAGSADEREGTSGPTGAMVRRQPARPLLEGRGNPAVPTPLGPTPLGPTPLEPTPVEPTPLGPTAPGRTPHET
jgi:agmatinase